MSDLEKEHLEQKLNDLKYELRLMTDNIKEFKKDMQDEKSQLNIGLQFEMLRNYSLARNALESAQMRLEKVTQYLKDDKPQKESKQQMGNNEFILNIYHKVNIIYNTSSKIIANNNFDNLFDFIERHTNSSTFTKLSLGIFEKLAKASKAGLKTEQGHEYLLALKNELKYFLEKVGVFDEQDSEL